MKPEENRNKASHVKAQKPADISVKTLPFSDSKIPTTFIPLSPEKLEYGKYADVLVGVFHVMWEDMPRRRTYKIRLRDFVARSGDCIGTSLMCDTSEINLHEFPSSK
jgi:hypothetical protein